MKPHLAAVLVTLAAALTCGATFLLALFRQFAIVEVAASLGTGVEVYLLSSSIGDLLEDKRPPSRVRVVAGLLLAGGIVGYFLVMKHLDR